MVLARANGCCMPTPTSPDPERGGDRIRALENDRLAQRRPGEPDGLEGLRELSTAWHENRSTSHLLGKGWSDPLARLFFCSTVLAIVIGIVVLLLQ